jgi:hypothetical protein
MADFKVQSMTTANPDESRSADKPGKFALATATTAKSSTCDDITIFIAQTLAHDEPPNLQQTA